MPRKLQEFLARNQHPRGISSISSNDVLPRVNYFATLGELAENYRGTTNVMFHRSNAIYRATGIPVEILVFGHARDYQKLNEQMHADGRLEAGVNFRNMWDDFEVGSLTTELPIQTFDSFHPLTDEATDEAVIGEGVKIQRVKNDQNGNISQVDMLRSDGSLIFSECRDLATELGKTRASYILANNSGQPVLKFNTITAYRNFWLDHVIGAEKAVLFSDSFRVANYIHKYKRPNVISVQTFHNNHLHRGAATALGETEDRYLTFLRNVDDFDAVVMLTERQKSDVDVLMGKAPNRWVVPNSRSAELKTTLLTRKKTFGMTAGQLSQGKQVHHAIDAIARANDLLDIPVTLEIFGDGPLLPELELAANELTPNNIRFHGYQHNVAEKFESASFSLLTSTSEAMPLVLIESMARGCIPIAYDIKYGPSDIISHGNNGFLIQRDNIEELAKTIVDLQNLPDEKLQRMRERAVLRARQFSDTAVLKKWAHLLNATFDAKCAPEELQVLVEQSGLAKHKNRISYDVTIALSRPVHNLRAYLTVIGRDKPAIMRLTGKLVKVTQDKTKAKFTLPLQKIEWFGEGILDTFLDVYDEAGRRTLRLPFPRDAQEISFGGFVIYPTVHKNMSIKSTRALP